MSYENALQLALSDLKNGIYPSIRTAAEAYGVCRMSLGRRLQKSSQLPSIAHTYEQQLSPEQEEFLADWIIEEEEKECAPSHVRMRDMATRILEASGDPRPVGKKWVVPFLERNDNMASMIGCHLEVSRMNGTQPSQIEKLYDQFHIL